LSPTTSQRAVGAALHKLRRKRAKSFPDQGIPDHALELASGDIEGSNHDLGVLPAIFELSPLGPSAGRRDALQGLNAGHLVHQDRGVRVAAAAS
jgi:hypothetical protein